MLVPFALSLTAASVGLLAALLSLGMSSAPGWKELRWFAVTAALAAAFVLANMGTYLDVPTEQVLRCSRIAMFFGGLHTASWIKFAAVQRDTKLSRFDGAVMIVGVVLALVALVPGAYIENAVHARRVTWLGVTYRDGILTGLGNAVLTYHVCALVLVFGRYVRAAFRGESTAWTYAAALGVTLACAFHDSLAMSGDIDGPYVLDVAVLVLVLAATSSLTKRFVESARALEISTRGLAVAQEELVERERFAALGELAAVVAHEVRNPLAVVYNALSVLKRAKPGERNFDELLGIAQEEAERIRKIVSNLLEFARPRPAIFAPVDLCEVVRGAVRGAVEAACAGTDDAPAGECAGDECSGDERAKVHVDLETDTEGLARFVCDEQLVRQALVHLVTNALQSPNRKRPVVVSVRHRKEPVSFGPTPLSIGVRLAPSVTIAVIDDGDGIPSDVRDRIFTPFFSTRASGAGLGLSVVRRTADAHGGEVALETTPGGGATFTLKLPMATIAKEKSDAISRDDA